MTQAHIIQYDRRKDNDYYNEIDRERRLQKRYDKMQADNTLVETTLDLEASIKENLARKQALKDEWVSIDKLWKEVAQRKDWENAKSSLDNNKPCKMRVNIRKQCALKRFRQRAIKKCKILSIDYKVEYVQSLKNGKLGNYNGKELFVRRKHLSLFFNKRNGYLKTSTLKHRQMEVINEYGVDNNLQEKLDRGNISYCAFLNRVNRGWSLQKAISTPAKNTNTDRFLQLYPHRAWEVKCPVKKTNKYILAEYEGKTFYRRRATLQDLLKENGITEKQFCNRIRNGWSFASATTLDKGGYTEEARKRHNKRDIAKHIKQSRAKRYR